MIISEISVKIFYYKNFIIFSLVLFFALQSLYFISLYKINFPYSMDYLGIDYLYDYVNSGVFPYEKIFSPNNSAFLIFPRLVAIPNLLFNSFNIINFYYIQWLVLSLSLYFIYLILKRTKKLYWPLIPISSFVYSPLINSNYWAFDILQWLLPSMGIIIVTYLLYEKITFKIFGAAIFFAIFSTFSIIAGIIVWLPGLFSLIRYNLSEKKWTHKKWLIGWLLCTCIVGSIYYYFVPKSAIEVDLLKFFSVDGLSFVTIFVSTAFRLKYPLLMIIVGTITISLSLFCVYYFTKIKKEIKIAFPWLLFLLVGLSSALITALGRVHLADHYGNEPYYIPMSQFVQIGLIILVSLIILDVKQKQIFKYRNSLLIFLYLVIIFHMILLIPSYYAGWWRGNYYYEEKSEFVNCFSLTHGAECVNTHSHGTLGAFKNDLNFNLINYWLKNKMNIFSDESFNSVNKQELVKFANLWNNENNIDKGFGEIETINEIEIINNNTIYLEDPFVILSGWALGPDMKQLDSIFLIVDNKPFLKYDDFQQKPDLVDSLGKNIDTNASWIISFLSGYLETGCHKISIIGIKDESKITFDQEIPICINNQS